MLSIHKIDSHYKHLQEVIDLYLISFPKNERDPINHLLKHNRKDSIFYAFEDDSNFIGLSFILIYKDIAHLLFFAISPKERNKGYGSKALELLHNRFIDKRIIVDCEDNTVIASNSNERSHRINFYLINNYKITDIKYKWHDVSYIILITNGDISKDDFDIFWKHFEFEEDMGEFLYLSFKHKKIHLFN